MNKFVLLLIITMCGAACATTETSGMDDTAEPVDVLVMYKVGGTSDEDGIAVKTMMHIEQTIPGLAYYGNRTVVIIDPKDLELRLVDSAVRLFYSKTGEQQCGKLVMEDGASMVQISVSACDTSQFHL